MTLLSNLVTKLSLCLFLFSRSQAELTVGHGVMGQMGQQIWAGHVGHGSVPVTS